MPSVDITDPLPYPQNVAESPRVHPVVRLIWKMERLRGRFSLPVGQTVGGWLFFGRPLLSNAWSLLMQTVIREPALRFRCGRIGTGLRLYGPAPRIMGDGIIELGNDVEFTPDMVLLVGLDASRSAGLYVGNDVRFGPNNMICVARQVRIGDHCRTGPGVKIYDTDMHAFDAAARRQNYGPADEVGSAPVCIENDVWIGANAIILKGVTLHRGAIVGAGAVVADDVPCFTIVAGNPARVVRHVPPKTDPGLSEQAADGRRQTGP
jgi:acetyltransferase-like isoleucine patch superfamily enzyme